MNKSPITYRFYSGDPSARMERRRKLLPKKAKKAANMLQPRHNHVSLRVLSDHEWKFLGAVPRRESCCLKSGIEEVQRKTQRRNDSQFDHDRAWKRPSTRKRLWRVWQASPAPFVTVSSIGERASDNGRIWALGHAGSRFPVYYLSISRAARFQRFKYFVRPRSGFPAPTLIK